MTTLIVPDTNALVQFKPFDQLPWREIVGVEGDIVFVVIAPVIRELDKLKLEPRLRERVRELLPRLEALFENGDEGRLPTGVPARFDHARDLQPILEAHALDRWNGDDLILAATLQLQRADAVVLVTDDTAMRLRARALGIRVQRIPEDHRLTGGDPLAAENARLRREVEQLRNAIPRLNLTFRDGDQVLRVTLERTTPRRRSVSDALELAPMQEGNLPMVYALGERERPTSKQIAEYNAALEEFRPTYEEYVRRRDEFEQFPFTAIRLALCLRNSGGVAAEKLRLAMTFPQGIRVVPEGDAPREPKKPRGPELPGRPRGLRTLRTAQDELVAAIAATRMRPVTNALEEMAVEPVRILRQTEPQGPEVRELEDGQVEALFTLGLLSNFDDVVLPDFFAHFPAADDARTFQIRYELRAHGVPKVVDGDLTVIVEIPREGGASSKHRARIQLFMISTAVGLPRRTAVLATRRRPPRARRCALRSSRSRSVYTGVACHRHPR